jgi:biopolymer transport protein ExbB
MLTIISASGWPIWPLLLISILGLAILLERTWSLQRKRISPKDALEQALTLSAGLKVKTSLSITDMEKLSSQSVLGSILSAGLRSLAMEKGNWRF